MNTNEVRVMNQNAPDVPAGIHLNLGCGKKIWPGFVNVDFPGNWSGKKPDVECDLHELPFEDGYADSVYAIHVLEHFYRWETEAVLREWTRVLKPGGRLIIEVPCLDRVIAVFMHVMKNGIEFNEDVAKLTMHRLYGHPKYRDPHMVHRWCFSVHELKAVFEFIGLKDVVVCEPEYHSEVADMRVEGVKQ